MNSENINQTLSQLESSLRELDSARIQVEKVTEAGNNLTIATSALVNEVKLLADQIGNDTTTIITGFSEKLSDFDKKLNHNSDLSQKSIRDGINIFSELTGTLKQKTENAIEELKTISVKTIQNQESEISKKLESTLKAIEKETTEVNDNFAKKLSESQEKFNNLTDEGQKRIVTEVEKFRASATDLKATSENAISEIKTISTQVIKDQEVKISKTINSISNYCVQVQSLIDKLAEFDFDMQLNKLDTNISGIHPALQDVQGQIRNLETSITDKLNESNESQSITLSNFQEKLNQSIAALVLEMNVSAKKQQTNLYITWALIVIGALSIILLNIS